MNLKLRLLSWGVRLRQWVCTLSLGAIYACFIYEEYTVLIRPYISYIGFYAPFIDERIQLSYILDTLSKEFITGEPVGHLMIE